VIEDVSAYPVDPSPKRPAGKIPPVFSLCWRTGCDGHSLRVRHPKEGGTKWVPVDDEDRALVRGMPRGFAGSPFFGACAEERGVAPEKPFAERRLYAWWKKACANLGVEGVDFYGETRQSPALRSQFSPEQIKGATMHTTNVAFERYFQTGPEDLKDLYAAARTGATPCPHPFLVL